MRHRGLGQPHLRFRQREPSCRPCVREPRAALSPATVRSRISSRSNSANAAKMPETRQPAAVVVSICAPWPAGEHPQAHAAGRQVLHGVDEMGEVAAQAVELPDHEHVALPQGAQAAVESWPVVTDAGGEVVVQVDRVDAGGLLCTCSFWP